MNCMAAGLGAIAPQTLRLHDATAHVEEEPLMMPRVSLRGTQKPSLPERSCELL